MVIAHHHRSPRNADGAPKIRVIALVLLLSWAPFAYATNLDPHPSPDQPGHSGHAGHDASSIPRYTSEDPDTAYSLFMHHSAGAAVLLVGLFLLADRLTRQHHLAIRAAIGSTWLLLGLYLLIRSDPEGWPMGPVGFIDSFSMPTAPEWIQHKVLSLIPVVLGVLTLATRPAFQQMTWHYVLAGVAAFGGLGLLIHQHSDHPGFDMVNLQHRIFAATAFFIAFGLVVEKRDRPAWKVKRFFVPCGVSALGLELLLYIE